MVPENNPALQECPNCASLIDVSVQEPFAQIHCPVCDGMMRVRTQFNNFTLVDVLGSGGMGAVYRALDTTLNRYVALKIMRREFSGNPEYLAQFEKEAQLTAAVNDRHVIKVFSYGEAHGSFYIAMELVSRGSLEDLMTAHKRLSELDVIQMGSQIAQGLRAAYQNGLIHRDIKPGNILFAEANTAKIVDFGLATVFEKDAEMRGEVWGTPYYVPPERLKHEVEDFRSDIYSLGATLFHAIAGKPPFEANTPSVAALRHLKSGAVSLLEVVPDVSSATAVVIERMLKQKPEERFQSYDELIEMLAYAQSKVPLEGRTKVKATPIAVPAPGVVPKKSGWLSPIAVGGVLLVAGVAGYSYFHGNGVWLKKLNELTHQGDEHSGLSGSLSQSEVLLRKYQEARQKLISGDYAGASNEFSQIQDSASIKPLMLRWVLFHKGVAQLLAGKIPESEASFSSLSQAGTYSDAPTDQPLAQFFLEVGRLGANASQAPQNLPPADESSAFDALGRLVLGLKLLQADQLEQANAFLTSFEASSAEENFQPYMKVADFKAIARRSLNEASLKASKAANVNAAPSNTPNAEGTEIEKTQEDQKKKEEAVLAKLQERFFLEVSAYHFSAARSLFESNDPKMELKAEEFKKKQAVLMSMGQWLDDFKKGLIADLNREGFPSAIKGTKGSTLEGGITGANEKEIQLKNPYGSIPIAWAKISPDSILEMAIYYLKKERDPAAFSERKWRMGVYACQFGKANQWRPVLTELASAKSEYADCLDGMLELSR